MTKKLADIKKARQERRQRTGWTLEEIRKRADEENEAYKALDASEPDNLVSGGDMKKILEEEENDEKD